MKLHLGYAPTPHRIQLPVSLKPPVQPFNRRSAPVDHLPFGGLVRIGESSFVRGIGVDDGLRVVLSSDERPELSIRVRSVGKHVGRVEFAVSESRLRQQRPCHLGVVNVTGGDLDSPYGKLPSRVTKNMGLVPPYILLVAFCIGLDHSSSIRVGHCSRTRWTTFLAFPALLPSLLAAVRPCLDVRAVHSDRFTEAVEFLIHTPRKVAHNVGDLHSEGTLGQFRTKPTESRLTGDVVGGMDTADGDYPGVIRGGSERGQRPREAPSSSRLRRLATGFRGRIPCGHVA